MQTPYLPATTYVPTVTVVPTVGYTGCGTCGWSGWTPTVTNEQAYVEGTEAKWWTMVSPKRRQELSLGGLVVLILIFISLVIA